MNFSRFAVLALTTIGLSAGCSAGAPEDATGSTESGITREECRARPEADAECRVEGVIERMVGAEFDPFVVGDACAIFLKVGNRRYGLMRELEACDDADRYEGAGVKAWFNKGRITLVAREKAEVMKDFDADATYYDMDGTLHIDPLPTPAPGDLAAFDALASSAKVDALYEGASNWGTLRAGYVETPIRILDAIPAGEQQRAALDAYRELREYSFASGGDKPNVYAIQKDGVTYAYAMAASGSYHGGSWSDYVVFDRAFEELTRFSYSE